MKNMLRYSADFRKETRFLFLYRLQLLQAAISHLALCQGSEDSEEALEEEAAGAVQAAAVIKALIATVTLIAIAAQIAITAVTEAITVTTVMAVEITDKEGLCYD